jgi:hypothetical protein
MERKLITLDEVEVLYTRQQLSDQLMYSMVCGLLFYCDLDVNDETILKQLDKSENNFLSSEFCFFYQAIKEQQMDKQISDQARKNYAKAFNGLGSYSTDELIELIKTNLRDRVEAKELLGSLKN